MRDYEKLVERLHKRIGSTVAGSPLQDDLLEAADAIEDLENKLNLWRQDKISRWIPVEERLPELHEEVLVCNEEYGLSGLGFATAAVWDGTDWIETWDRRAAIHCVSHWMPLPEPPKEKS